MITLEVVVLVARGGNDMQKYGDPFDAVCTLVKVDDETLMIKGLVNKHGNVIITKAYLKELKKAVSAFGFTKLTWERKK